MCHSDCPPPSTVAVLHESGYWWESDPIELCAFPCELHLCTSIFVAGKCYFPLGSSCQEGGSQESGEDCSEKVSVDCSESKYVFVSNSEGESGEGWESAIDDDSLYLPAPDRPVQVNYIDLPNKLCFLALPQVGKFFLDMINQVRGCKTPGCNGKLAPTCVMSNGLGGCVYMYPVVVMDVGQEVQPI